MRGLGWGKKNSRIDYVYQHPYSWLVQYHHKVMDQMKHRGMNVDSSWETRHYRGKKLEMDFSEFTDYNYCPHPMIYLEHDERYVNECLKQLAY